MPFAFVQTLSRRASAHANALASGLMLGASIGLAVAGARYGNLPTAIGVAGGMFFIWITRKYLDSGDAPVPLFRGAGARSIFLTLIVMTLHSFAEGVALGSAFAGGLELGVLATVAIAVHNVPEGLAISAVLRPRGMSLAACAGWSVVSSLPQPLMAVPAFLFVDSFAIALPYGLGFAAGAMVLMVFVEILPDAYKEGRYPEVSTTVSVALLAMMLFQSCLG